MPSHCATGSPPPIIVKFVHYRDLEAVLQKRNLLGKGQQVLQDLPQVMKQERHKLAGIAYDIRKHEHLRQEYEITEYI
ncbi:hypothetical protein SNE40_001231 [Patella caerulea]|uniref:Uncharacterized protein n=1 Tax=Patella caerulea TaxID=87958 RepID=A0AAN8QHU6_PATCE